MKKKTTLSEHLIFHDADLSTPEHDSIMIWLDKNVELILPRVYKLDSDDSFGDIERTWEFPIEKKTTQSTSVIGYADLFVSATIQRTRINEFTNAEYIDTSGSVQLFIEVKPRIRSVGETIRQIRHYSSAFYRAPTWMIVSPDTRFADVFKSQGFYFLNPSDMGWSM